MKPAPGQRLPLTSPWEGWVSFSASGSSVERTHPTPGPIAEPLVVEFVLGGMRLQARFFGTELTSRSYDRAGQLRALSYSRGHVCELGPVPPPPEPPEIEVPEIGSAEPEVSGVEATPEPEPVVEEPVVEEPVVEEPVVEEPVVEEPVVEEPVVEEPVVEEPVAEEPEPEIDLLHLGFWEQEGKVRLLLAVDHGMARVTYRKDGREKSVQIDSWKRWAREARFQGQF